VAVTLADLKALYPSALTDPQYQTALDTAEMIVTEQLRPSCPMTEARYDKVTLYLAAHFASVTANFTAGNSGALKSQKIGAASESYATIGEGEYGYSTSPWGQAAIQLDTCGILAASGANKGLKALFTVVGDAS